MRICVLASGSKGNCTYVETDNTKSLIDAGMSCSYIENALKDIGVEPSSIERNIDNTCPFGPYQWVTCFFEEIWANCLFD
ncbi:MAG: hypothetical protein V8R01_02230 [Bacilli bacterium]